MKKSLVIIVMVILWFSIIAWIFASFGGNTNTQPRVDNSAMYGGGFNNTQIMELPKIDNVNLTEVTNNQTLPLSEDTENIIKELDWVITEGEQEILYGAWTNLELDEKQMETMITELNLNKENPTKIEELPLVELNDEQVKKIEEKKE